MSAAFYPLSPPLYTTPLGADSYVEIQSVASDGSGNAVLTIEPNTPPVYGFLPNARFYGVNILSELDASGEYFVDIEKELLYWMPPPGGVASTREVVISVSQALILGSSVANVRFEGLQLLYARGTGLTLLGAVNATVSGCTSANHGRTGIELYGAGIVLRDSLVYGTGCEGTSVAGGDLATLTPSLNLVVNNSVHHFARVTRTYNPGIRFSDVGGVYANNTIAHGPHTGMTGGGALNLFVGNTFQDLLFEASDAGAFYVGYSWTQRGNVIRGNTFKRLRPTERTFLGYPSVQAVYLDDEQSGYVIEDNVCEVRVLLSGGGVPSRGNACFLRDLAAAGECETLRPLASA